MTKIHAVWIATTCHILFSRRCAANTTTTESEFEPIIQLLSDQNHLHLAHNPLDTAVTPRGYEHFNPAMLENITMPLSRRYDYVQYQLSGFDPSSNYIIRVCHILLGTWRRAKLDMLNYYKIRDVYVGTRDYEIGYLTHVIISKYMDTLEILNIVRYRYLGGGEHTNYAPSTWMWYMYTNIMENSRAIIHYCNMMHEIDRKYDTSFGGDTPWDQMTIPGKPKPKLPQNKGEAAPPEAVEAAMTQREYLEKQERERKKKIRMEAKRHKEAQKLGVVTMSRTNGTRRPVRYWKKKFDLDYGWSIEDGAW